MSAYCSVFLASLSVFVCCGCGDTKPSGDANPGGDQQDAVNPMDPLGNAPFGQQGSSQTMSSTITSANFKKIKANTSKEELLGIFGPPGKNVTGAQVADKLFGDPNWGVAYDSEVQGSNTNVELLAYTQEGGVLLINILNENEPEQQLRGKVLRAWMATRKGDNRTGTLTYEVLDRVNGRFNYSQQTVPVPGTGR